MSALITVTTQKDFIRGVETAAEILLSGGIVAYPTETFYGLAVDVRNEAAVKRLFEIKKRSADQPVLLIIGARGWVKSYVTKIPPAADVLMDKFWPGNLTLVFEAGQKIFKSLTGGSEKIGIRLSSHPLATALSRAINAPISGTSANISGQPACCTAKAVSDAFGKSIDLILDHGKTPGEKGSTVVDVTVNPPRILRQGVIRLKQFAAASIPVCVSGENQ